MLVVGAAVELMKVPDGLTVKVTTNVRDKTTRITAYRAGGFRRAYKAVLPMCTDGKCRVRTPHTRNGGTWANPVGFRTLYHQVDVDRLVKGIIKSYC